jgi:tripartite ATP-independent transporter DctM subunit
MAEGQSGERIVDLMAALVGRARGGLLHVIIVTMYLFSGISGSKAGDIAAIGSALSKRLNALGYPREESAAVLAASAAMGETIPPSIALLVLASVVNISVGTLFIAGLLPAAFLAVCLMILAYVRARTHNFPRGAPFNPRSALIALRRAALSLTSPIVLLGAIFSGFVTPTEGSAVAVVYASAITLRYGLSWNTLRLIADRSVSMIGMIMLIIAAAKAFSFALTFSGIASLVVSALEAVPGGPRAFLVVSVLVLIVLGSVFEGLPALLIFPPFLLPVATSMGISPIQFGILMIIAMGIGAFTPPLGVGVYVATSVSGTTMEATARPLAMYLLVLIAGAVALSLIPDIVLWLPRTLGPA